MRTTPRVRLSPQPSLRERLRPRAAVTTACEALRNQVDFRREFRASASPELTVHGQRFAVTRGGDGYIQIERWITPAGLLLHPWATLDGLAPAGERTYMMLKTTKALVREADGVSERDIVIIKQMYVAYPMQRTGLATELLRTVLREKYPDHLVQGEAPSADALAWHDHLNKIWPTRMLHFPEGDHEHEPLTATRVMPGARLNLSELKIPHAPPGS